MNELLTLLLEIALIGVVVWAILQIPMPAPFRNLIIAVSAIFAVLWLIHILGGSVGIGPRHLHSW